MRKISTHTNIVEHFNRFRRKYFFNYGLPFLLLLFIGSFGVERFASLRYEFRRNELLREENLEKIGIKKKKIKLEDEFEKIKQIDLNAWENIRGPRPWEETQQPQQKQN